MSLDFKSIYCLIGVDFKSHIINTYNTPDTFSSRLIYFSIGDVDEFNEVLSGLLDDLQDIIWLLSKGISESQQHFMDKDFVRRYSISSSHFFLFHIIYIICIYTKYMADIKLRKALFYFTKYTSSMIHGRKTVVNDTVGIHVNQNF